MLATIIRRTAIKHSAARFFSTRNAAGNIFFSKDHEYIKIISPGVGYVGISDHAQEALGELVYVDTPAVVRILPTITSPKQNFMDASWSE